VVCLEPGARDSARRARRAYGVQYAVVGTADAQRQCTTSTSTSKNKRYKLLTCTKKAFAVRVSVGPTNAPRVSCPHKLFTPKNESNIAEGVQYRMRTQ
jgi:hypothetical protein